jgi:hypothetical protein
MANAGMIITSIEEPESGIWRGTAKLGTLGRGREIRIKNHP